MLNPKNREGRHFANIMKSRNLNKNKKNIFLEVKYLRKKIGLTQVEFARRAGVGLRFLRELEQGKKTIRMDKLMRVLDFLGYDLELKKNGFQGAGRDE